MKNHIELQIHPDGSLWKDDVRLADPYEPSQEELSEAAKRLADAIDKDIAEKLFAQLYSELS